MNITPKKLNKNLVRWILFISSLTIILYFIFIFFGIKNLEKDNFYKVFYNPQNNSYEMSYISQYKKRKISDRIVLFFAKDAIVNIFSWTLDSVDSKYSKVKGYFTSNGFDIFTPVYEKYIEDIISKDGKIVKTIVVNKPVLMETGRENGFRYWKIYLKTSSLIKSEIDANFINGSAIVKVVEDKNSDQNGVSIESLRIL